MNTDYVIAIPSYKRAETLNKKTLSLLKRTDINLKEKIYIFVADEEEFEIYKEKISSSDYHSIIIGKHTLKEQRNFILQYFPIQTNIMNLDDDLYDLQSGYKNKETKEIITKNIFSLNRVFQSGFEECYKTGASLFGFYPVFNKFFMTNTITYNLTYIIGSCYGIINQRENQFVSTNDKEDFERSIKCFINDGKIIRFNFISFKTNYYTEKGGLQETRTVESIKAGAEYIFSQFPDYCKIKNTKKGRYEITLNKKMVVPKPSINDNKEYPLCLSIKREFNLINLRHQLLKKLNSTTIPTCEALRRDGKPSRSTQLFEIEDLKNQKMMKNRPRTVTLGYGRRRVKGYGPFASNSLHSELYSLLIRYGELVLPEDFKFTTITINKNLKAKKHKDKLNVGVSALTTLGNYQKGGLYIEGHLYPTSENILLFDGSKMEHETEQFTGDRFALIYYKQNMNYIPNEYIHRGTKKYT